MEDTQGLRVELLVGGLGVRVVAVGTGLGLVQRVAALVLLPHPMDDKHHQEDGSDQADDGSSDQS